MVKLGNGDMKNAHSLFGHKILKEPCEIIAKASCNTESWYGVAKCTEIVFKRGNMVKGEELQALKKGIETIELNQEEIYIFLVVEQADWIKTKEVYNRVK